MMNETLEAFAYYNSSSKLKREIRETVLPDFPNVFLLNAINFLIGRDNFLINPIIELLSSRAIQTTPKIIGYNSF